MCIWKERPPTFLDFPSWPPSEGTLQPFPPLRPMTSSPLLETPPLCGFAVPSRHPGMGVAAVGFGHVWGRVSCFSWASRLLQGGGPRGHWRLQVGGSDEAGLLAGAAFLASHTRSPAWVRVLHVQSCDMPGDDPQAGPVWKLVLVGVLRVARGSVEN